MSGPEQQVPPKAGAHSFDLSSKEQEQLQAAAHKGNAKAAFRLAMYFGITKNDVKEQVFWMRRAAELGHGTAQYNLGHILIYYPAMQDFDEAEVWLRKAAETAVAHRDKELLEAVREAQEELRNKRGKRSGSKK